MGALGAVLVDSIPDVVGVLICSSAQLLGKAANLGAPLGIEL